MPGYQESKSINGRNYTVSRLPFGIKNDPNSMRGVMAQLSKIVAESEKISEDYLGLLAQVVSRASSAEFSNVLAALGERTEFSDNGASRPLTESAQNLHWSDFPSDFVPWIVFALEVNFRDFFKGGTDFFGDKDDPKQAKIAKELLENLIS